MDELEPEEVRRALARLDAEERKIVAGLFAVMIREPERVRDREWVLERLTHVTLLAGEHEAATPAESVAAVQESVRRHADACLTGALLLFRRVAADLAPRAAAGFDPDGALRCGLGYLPGFAEPGSPARGEGGEPHAGQRDLGEQPLAALMAARGLAPKDLVAASGEQLTHKMVARAVKGRRLTANTMGKVVRAWNRAAERSDAPSDLFTYEP